MKFRTPITFSESQNLPTQTASDFPMPGSRRLKRFDRIAIQNPNCNRIVKKKQRVQNANSFLKNAFQALENHLHSPSIQGDFYYAAN
jgi:hypothetical protein